MKRTERIEVWQDEDQVAQPQYSWIASVWSFSAHHDDAREETCLVYGVSALDAIECAIREARRRKLRWGISDRYAEYTDMTGQPALWALAFIEEGIRQRGVFIARHLREIEREEDVAESA
jgi:hypothetical protein